jgi:hypothetical protein
MIERLATLSPDVLLAFVFGAVFLCVLLAVAIFVTRPTPLLVTVIKIIIALAAAGVAATIPGFISLEIAPSAEMVIRAGGAIAVFVLVFFFVPAGLIPDSGEAGTEPDPPSEAGNPEVVVTEWLSLMDKKEFSMAYSQSSVQTQAEYSPELFRNIFQEHRAPRGDVMARKILAAIPLRQLPTGQRGNFRGFQFRTSFSNDGGRDRIEAVVVKAEGGVWKVTSYNISPETFDPALKK